MKKFLKVALIACACALIAVPFVGCDLGSNKFKVSQSEWEEALTAEKFSHKIGDSTHSTTTYVDGNVARIVTVDNEDGTSMYYLEKVGQTTWRYDQDPEFGTWNKSTSSYSMDIFTLAYVFNGLDYTQFTYDSTDKCYTAQDILLTGDIPASYDEMQIHFENKSLKKIVINYDDPDQVGQTLTFLSTNFTITLPSVS